MNKGIQENPLFKKTVKQQNGKTVKQQNVNIEEKIVKMTCYLTQESAERLEKIWYEVRTKQNTKLTRSFIVNRAIDLLEKDFNEKQEKCFLLKSE